jgi:hypothetical protein
MAGITGLSEFCDSLGLLTCTADDMGSVCLAFTHERDMVICRHRSNTVFVWERVEYENVSAD